MYPLLIIAVFCTAYLFLHFFFPLFFHGHTTSFRKSSFLFLGLVILGYAVVWYITSQIVDVNVSNRILHIFGGGFLAFFMCFLISIDTKIRVDRFRLFTFILFVVLSLGVANEMMEYVLGLYTPLTFADTADDTRLDLISNCVGAVLAIIMLIPFSKKQKSPVPL